MIDLRSDTVTLPTADVRAAMAAADVGDDQYGEDPSVRRLEELAAGMLGHEAAVFTPSATMANQLALRVHTRHGDEVVCGEWAHIRNHEWGAAGALAGIQWRTIPDLDCGHPGVDALARTVGQDAYHLPPVTLVCLENTHNCAGGRAVLPSTLACLRDAAGSVPVHLDGARLFNAAVALGVDASTLAAVADTVTICLTKGLGAPVGALLAGSREAITTARRWRSAYGGAMRQAGVIAAAGEYVLTHHVDRLADDHFRADRLAAAIGADPPHTNMVLLDLGDRSVGFIETLASHGVRAGHIRPGVVRFALHLDIDDAAVGAAAAVILTVLGTLSTGGAVLSGPSDVTR